MILKEVDDKSQAIATLEHLIEIAPPKKKKLVKQELWRLRAGMKGEQEAAYILGHRYANRDDVAVIHDLRLNINGRVAQIDHLVLIRTMECFVFETKHFNAGMKITATGEFLRWNQYRNSYEGMRSPIAQNERHVEVLEDAFEQIGLPTRLGVTLRPTYRPFVLVSPEARIIRPRHEEFDTSAVIKADDVIHAIKSSGADDSLVKTLAKFVSAETVQRLGEALVALHEPLEIDYYGKFGIERTPEPAPVAAAATTPPAPQAAEPAAAPADTAAPPKSPASPASPACKGCGGQNLTGLYGKYGYYLKCADCGTNTPMRPKCPSCRKAAKVKKEKSQFFGVCDECGEKFLFWQNQA